jgi:hypothetical protein
MFSKLIFYRINNSNFKISKKCIEQLNITYDLFYSLCISNIFKLIDFEINDEDCEDIIELYKLLNDTKKIKNILNINEIKTCITKTILSYKNIWLKYPEILMNIGSVTLYDFLNKTKIKYDVILSISHLFLLLNYYMYSTLDNYFEKEYCGDDKYTDMLKILWNNKVKDGLRVCEICENIYESVNNKKLKIKVNFT